MIYEYAPQFPKRRERLLCLFFLFLGAALFLSTYLPEIPVRWVFQLLAVASFTAMIMILGMYLMRRYVYTVTEGEGSEPDFVITEYYGRRKTVVSRVSVSSVRSVTPKKHSYILYIGV